MKNVWAAALAALSLALGRYSLGVEDRQTPSPETEPSTSLPVITVTAGRLPFDPSAETTSITVLERDALSRSEERDLNGVFRGLPGVTLQMPGSRGTLSTLIVRGVSSGLGQLSFDGVLLYSSVNGGFNLSTFPADALERVEVVRGASAPRYGSRALGGIARLSSREAHEDLAFLHLEGGSYGTLSETAGLGLTGPRAGLAVTASRDDVLEDISLADRRNGNHERDDFRATQGVARLSLRPTARLTVESSVLYKHSHAEIDGPGLLPTGQIGQVDDEGAFAREESWVAQTTAEWRVLPGFESSLRLGFTRNRASLRASDLPAGFDQRLLLARWVNTQRLYHSAAEPDYPLVSPELELCWGAEVQQEEGANQFDLPRLPLQDARTLLAGLLELRGGSGPWSGFLGTSIDHYDDVGTHPTLYGGIGRWVTPSLKLRASGGRGYRPPAFHERYFVPLFGNPDLVPEQGWSADLGLDWLPDSGTRLAITGLYHRFDDLIVLSRAPTLSLFVGENVPDARVFGVELEGSRAWGKGLTTGVDYTFMDSRDLETDRDLPLRPQHQSRAYAEWQLPKLPLTLWLELVYRGRHFDDRDESVHVGEATYLNAQLSYEPSPRLRVYLRGENLTDDRTPEFFSFGARGAAVFAGVRLDL